ncbi:PH domain-containing protein DDB_G0287875-like [Macrobrachium nipponense]|uniref:PH domain-containing protein DDB_G0287875-like n=1 Tax=Macrobrachium nipponense TaxID=159736 RepID=UPI0030C827DF
MEIHSTPTTLGSVHSTPPEATTEDPIHTTTTEIHSTTTTNLKSIQQSTTHLKIHPPTDPIYNNHNPTTSTTTTPITTSTTTTSTATTSPTTTPKPKTKKEVLEETDTVLQNINSTLQEFQDALTSAEATTTTPKPVSSTETSRLQREDLRRPLIDLLHFKIVLAEAEESRGICVENADPKCKALEKTLNDIDDQLQILKNNIDSWDQENLKSLTSLNSDLNDQMSYATTPAFINANLDKTETNRRLESMRQNAEDAQKAVQDEIGSLTDGVIFGAVFGTLGGIILVALIANIAFRAIKNNKNKKNKEYNKISTASMPVDGFPRDQDNLGYLDNESARPRGNIYPMQNFSRPAPLARDPYRHPEKKPVEDLCQELPTTPERTSGRPLCQSLIVQEP